LDFDDILQGRLFSQYKSSPQFILVWLCNHDRVLSWNQPVLSNEGSVISPRKQLEPLMGYEPITKKILVRRCQLSYILISQLNKTYIYMLFMDISYIVLKYLTVW